MAEEISPLEDHGWWMEQLRKDAKANRPEALRLAALWEKQSHGYALTPEAETAAELRRLHALNGELLEALTVLCESHKRFSGGVWDSARAAIARAEGRV
jgi:hypothetical protein